MLFDLYYGLYEKGYVRALAKATSILYYNFKNNKDKYLSLFEDVLTEYYNEYFSQPKAKKENQKYQGRELIQGVRYIKMYYEVKENYEKAYL